jgi:hypothetical protein
LLDTDDLLCEPKDQFNIDAINVANKYPFPMHSHLQNLTSPSFRAFLCQPPYFNSLAVGFLETYTHNEKGEFKKTLESQGSC